MYTHTHTHTHTQTYTSTHTLAFRGKHLHTVIPIVKGGTFLTSPGGHLTSFSQSGILLKPTVAATAGHVFKGFFLKAAATRVDAN